MFDPFFFGEEGRRRESPLSPSLVHNSVDNPYTPRSGKKFTFTPGSRRRAAGGHGQLLPARPGVHLVHPAPQEDGPRPARAGLVHPGLRRHAGLPYYQRFFLGGETQIRGVNIRTVGPIVDGRALGGNKFVLFNGEYYFDVGGPLRLLLFFDAGQAYLEGQNIDLSQLRTSTGVELRFIMPVLNVPFRLIYAFNPNRDRLPGEVDLQVRRRHHVLRRE